MKIDNPYHNPFCDHKNTPRPHCHAPYFLPRGIHTLATLFLTISHLATPLSYLCDRNREDTHARDT